MNATTFFDEKLVTLSMLTHWNGSTEIENFSSSKPFLYFFDIPNYVISSYLAIGAIGLAGNILVCSVLVINRSCSKNTTEKLILHQTIIDGLTSFWIIITAVFPPFFIYSSSPSIWEHFICRVWATQTPMWVCFSSSCFNLVAITFEQYFGIVHSIFHKAHLKNIKIAIPVSLIWFLSAAFNAVFSISVSNIIDGMCFTASIFPNLLAAYIAGLSCLLYYLVIPTSLMIGCFCHMIYVIHKKARQTAPAGMVTCLNQAKLSMVKTLGILVVTFICCWSLNIWVMTLGIFNVIDSSFYQNWQWLLSGLLLFSTCFINPFIFAINNKKIRKQLQRCLALCFCPTLVQTH